MIGPENANLVDVDVAGTVRLIPPPGLGTDTYRAEPYLNPVTTYASDSTRT